MANLTADALTRLVNHIGLPPRLPQQKDPECFSDLVTVSLAALQALSEASPAHSDTIADAVNLLNTSHGIHDLLDNNINELRLRQALEDGKPAFLHVRAQNAGVLITYDGDGSTVVEQFELSAHNEAVMTTQGRLLRTFPGSAICIKSDITSDIGFQTTFAHTLSVMCHQTSTQMQPQVQKTGQNNAEFRDTTHPGLISELFVGGFLKAVGVPIGVSSILKHTRDDVLWNHVLLPWRRSPAWLLIRVALHLTLSRSNGGSSALFKQFMALLMAQLLENAVTAGFAGDLIFVLTAKVTRRLEKLKHKTAGQSPTGPVMHIIRQGIQAGAQESTQQWTAIQKRKARSIRLSKLLPKLDFEQDSLHTLPDLDAYIQTLSHRKQESSVGDFTTASKLTTLKPTTLPSATPKDADLDYALASLQQFETWISSNLEQWAQSNENQDEVCERLRNLLTEYHVVANRAYAQNPEALSLMLLTCLEIWKVCDQTAVRKCSLLAEYNHGFPEQVFQNLLFVTRDQMTRLGEVTTYLGARRRNSIHPSDLLLSACNPNGFAAKYFDQSTLHQSLEREIVARGNSEKERKLRQFAKLKEKHAVLVKLHIGSTCQYLDVVVNTHNGMVATEKKHSQACKKCGDLKRAQGLQIKIFEAPLPEDQTRSKVVVFELQAPLWYTSWRDARTYLLRNVILGKYVTKAPRYRLTYPLAGDWHLPTLHLKAAIKSQRIGLLSEAKPKTVAHYGSKCVGDMTKNDLCKKSGVSYEYYDSDDKVFYGELNYDQKHELAHVYPLGEPLGRFIFRPSTQPNGPSHNLAIASQHRCPDNMTLDEYKELCTLPLGHRIQWQNMLMQLVAPGVDFRKPETTLVFLQCIHQTGPWNGAISRSNHTLLSDNGFATTLLSALITALHRMKENWESSQALIVFTAIGARILSFCSSTEIQSGCLEFLASVRKVALDWVVILRSRANHALSADERASFVAKSVDVALICATSYEVDAVYLRTILSSSQGASALVQLSITVQEGRALRSPEFLSRLLLLRFRRLLHRAYPLLSANTTGIDLAIRQCWSSHRSGTEWRASSAAVPYWLCSMSSALSGNTSSSIHYNLLTGELLVRGLPVDCPPRQYQETPLYKSLFGHTLMAVMPSTVQGMRFSVKETFHGYDVSLNINGRGDLLVQTSLDTNVCETIPARLLQSHLPGAFGSKFVHFYDFDNKTVEFRPVATPWNRTAPGIWRLKKYGSSSQWQLECIEDGGCLINKESPTANAIETVFKALSPLDSIHSVLQTCRSAIEIEIPALRLGFSLSRGTDSLWSREYRGMKVDSDQSIGTLIGLHTKLILRTSLQSGPKRRMILIPEGEVSYRSPPSSPRHPFVSIRKTAEFSKVHALEIDKQLGRLTGSGSLDSRLLLSYLHALTAYHLPDRLTGTTGTEQALTELNSATVRSFVGLTKGNILLLTRIAKLTPARAYYPQNRSVMQQVTWDPEVGFLAQHGGFSLTVASIFEQARRSEIFYPDSQLHLPSLEDVDNSLLRRDQVRSSSHKKSGHGAEDHTDLYDTRYEARDKGQSSQRCSNAFLASSFFFNGAKELYWDAEEVDHLWSLMSSLRTVSGASCSVDLSKLCFDIEVMSTSQQFVLQNWLPLHEATRDRHNADRRKFSIMTWLSTIGFSDNVDLQLLQTLAALFTFEDVYQIPVPSMETCNPSCGREIDMSELRKIIAQHTISAVPPRRGMSEEYRTYEARRQSALKDHERESGNAVALFASMLGSQMLRPDPLTPNFGILPDVVHHIKVKDAMAAIRCPYGVWYANAVLYRYLRKLETAVRKTRLGEIKVPGDVPLNAKVDTRRLGYVSVGRMFAETVPPAIPTSCQVLRFNQKLDRPQISARKSASLETLITRLETTAGDSKYKRTYIQDLTCSLASLQRIETSQTRSLGLTETLLNAHLVFCQKRAETIEATLASTLRSSVEDAAIAEMCPRISPLFLLSQLSYGQWPKLNSGWRAVIVQYGLALSAWQRAERIVKAFRRDADGVDLISELQNDGHRSWSPLEHPESLLIEVEGGIMIRDVQESIASQMRSPPDSHNACMQLNMGEGKSSLIVPIVACALANGLQLVRVIVSKPQAKQLAEMLKLRLGSTVGRRLYYMPFSRSLKLTRAATETVAAMCQECMHNGGILLMQPEHILSFSLMATECYVTAKTDVGQSLLHTRDFFNACSRDIVDESDEAFSVKLELIYTIGMQRPIENSPYRWLHIQRLLEVVRTHASAVAEAAPKSIEIHPCSDRGFPRIRILEPDGGHLLIQRIARHICNVGFQGFPLGQQTQTVQQAVYTYLTKLELTRQEVDAVEACVSNGFWSDSTASSILLLRGMLGGGVLSFAFGQNRWRVTFGQVIRDPPTKLAVPFHAKDTPAPRSEFSHPDVVIVLTSLSYYYGGLGDEELFTAFGHLMKSDQADTEYQAWVLDADNLAPAFAQLQGINLKDRQQCILQLFPTLRRGKSVIDYYLSHIVFAKEMREYPSKMSASGWQISGIKQHPTTGFSGTSDTRVLLPLDMNHLDLKEQSHTNALVLSNLLGDENTVDHMPSVSEVQMSDAERILSTIIGLPKSPEVVLDVGAQVLELDNLQFAKRWLQMRCMGNSAKEAVIFVNVKDELSVVDRKGRIELLSNSSFGHRLDACLIFLDEAHTRGTDLQLPRGYRAAVTLGANLTKDRLVQGM